MGDILQEADLILILNNDLKHEWQHLKFYLHHASMLIGLHAEEYSEVFMKQAAGEMNHVRQFSDMIIGLGGVPTHENLPFNSFRHVEEALQYALRLEQQVVANYSTRIGQADLVGGVNGKWLELFLERQLEDSRTDVDRLKRLLGEI